MPQIFQKRTQLKPSYALHNLPIRIQNNGKIIALAILGVIALASGIVVLGLMRFQSIPYELKIDGRSVEKFKMPRISRRTFSLPNGRDAILVSRGWSTTKLTAKPNYRLRRRDGGWEIHHRDQADETHFITLKRGWGVSTARRNAFGGDDAF